VDVDAGPVLVVVPATGQLLTASAVAQVGLAVGLADWDLVGAAGTDALLKAGSILAGAGHAKLHLAPLRPLLLLPADEVAHDSLLVLAVLFGHDSQALSLFLRGLVGQSLKVLLHQHVTPDHIGPSKSHAPVKLAHLARDKGGVRDVLFLLNCEPVAMLAVVDLKPVILTNSTIPIALATWASVILVEILRRPGGENGVADRLEVHFDCLFAGEGGCLLILESLDSILFRK